MKFLYILPLFLIGLLPFSRVQAQDAPTPNQLKRAAESIDKLLYDYQASLAIKGKETAFAGLFSETAKIADDLVPKIKDNKFLPDEKTGVYSFETCSPKDYTALILNTYTGPTIVINNINIDYAKMGERSATVKMARRFFSNPKETIVNAYGTDAGNIRTENNDVIVLQLRLSEDYREAKIENISVVENNYVCNNCDYDKDKYVDKSDKHPLIAYSDIDGDKFEDVDDACPKDAGIAKFNGCPDTDEDGIQDKDDDCPKDKGLKELKGCPDRDSDGITDKDDECPDNKGLSKFNGCPDRDDDGIVDYKDKAPDDYCPNEDQTCLHGKHLILQPRTNVGVFVGLGLNNAIINHLGIEALHYDSFEKPRSTLAAIKNGGAKMGLGLGLMGDYGFGRRRNFGLATGLWLRFFSNDISIDKFEAQFKSQDTKNLNYRRIITADKLQEMVKMTTLSIPLMLSYRHNFSEKLSIFAQVGPVFNFLASGKSTASAAFDYEAIYGFDRTNNSFGFSTTDSQNDWQITEQNVSESEHNANEVNAYFEDINTQRGTDVQLNKDASKDAQTFKYGLKVGTMFYAGMNYYFSEKWGLRAGIMGTSFSGKNVNDKYQITNKRTEYTTLMKMSGEIKFSSYGLSIGLLRAF